MLRHERKAMLERWQKVSDRVAAVGKKIMEHDPRNSRRVQDVFEGQWLQLVGYFDAEELRALANALDGEDDWKDALLKDLKVDSAAYQRGLEDGKKLAHTLYNCGEMLVVRPGGFLKIVAVNRTHERRMELRDESDEHVISLGPF